MNLASPTSTRMLRDDDGVTAIEYALLASLVAMVVLGGMIALGASIKDLYDFIASKMPPAP